MAANVAKAAAKEAAKAATASGNNTTKAALDMSTPFVLPGAALAWPALTKWTPEFFSENFGMESTTMRTQPLASVRGIAMNEQFFETPVSSVWPSFNQKLEQTVHSWGPQVLDKAFAPLRDDYSTPEELQEYCSNNVLAKDREFWMWIAPEQLKFIYQFFWVHAGPKDAFTRLHVDPFGTASWTGVISGRKRFYLYPPWARDALSIDKTERDHRGGLMPTFLEDFRNPDEQSFPNFKHAEGIEVEIGKGDAIYVPADWAFGDINLEENTMTISENFVTVREAEVFFNYVKRWTEEAGFCNEMDNLRWQIVKRHLVTELKKQLPEFNKKE